MFRSAPDYIESYYSATTRKLQLLRSSLLEDLDVDVCVVGAGFFGLYTALELARAGQRVAVLEASRIGWGASGRNGGQMIIGFPCGMQRLKGAIGPERARRMFDASRAAVRDIRAIMSRYAIDCDLVEGHLEVAVLRRRVGELADWVAECAGEWGYDGLQFVARKDLPQYLDSPRFQAGVVDPEGAHIHPLKYVLGLARAAEAEGVRIHEQSRVDGYEEKAGHIEVRVGHHRVRCDRLVLAANAYVDGLDRRLAARTLPVGTFIATTAPLGEALARRLIPRNHAVYDNQFILEYFRMTADHRLLFGGKCTYLGGTPAHLAQAMKRNVVRVFPQLADVRMDHAWGGHIDITLRRMPDWGQRDGRVFWAQGFCGHGLVPTRVAARLVVDKMLGKSDELDWFASIVNPPFPGGAAIGGLLQAIGMSYYRLRDFV